MKKALLILSFFLSVAAFSQEGLLLKPKILRQFWVSLDDENHDFFTLYVRTVHEEPSICPLIISKMEIKKMMKNQNGAISLTVIKDPDAICLMAFGHRSGSFTFEKGKELPMIPEGRYQLQINGLSYGYLDVDEENVSLSLLKEFSQSFEKEG